MIEDIPYIRISKTGTINRNNTMLSNQPRNLPGRTGIVFKVFIFLSGM